jgi:hypothetical protein
MVGLDASVPPERSIIKEYAGAEVFHDQAT